MSVVVDRQAMTEAPQRFALRRLGVVMTPNPDEAWEAHGVLNPGGVRGQDGHYYLFPRIVAPGNYSRVSVARVVCDGADTPCAVERLGLALEPAEPYERNSLSGGGCEDPRVVYLANFGTYLMTYVAFGPRGPRVAVARSRDLRTWTRLGLLDFAPFEGIDMNAYGNKDAALFPEPVPGPDGRPSLALLHRPMYESWLDHGVNTTRLLPPPPSTSDRRWAMWISFCPLDEAAWAGEGSTETPRFGQHSLLALPRYAWESLRLGGGTPPVRLAEGWLTIYHGVGMARRGRDGRPGLEYSAGALLLHPDDPRQVLYRSTTPVLAPLLPAERTGIVNNVVFPTAVDVRSTYADVYYGMADAAIGVARMDLAPHASA